MTEEYPYRLVGVLRRLDEEIHMLDVTRNYSPLWEKHDRDKRFKQYADELAARASLAKRHWTPVHGGDTWQDYLRKLYNYAWKAYDCEPQDTDMVVADTDENPVVYFVKRCNCQYPTKSTSLAQAQ